MKTNNEIRSHVIEHGDWYVLIKGEVKAQYLNKKQAFDFCEKYHKNNPKVDKCRILMCRTIKRKGMPVRYSEMSYSDFTEISKNL
jgi:hypothetical protein